MKKIVKSYTCLLLVFLCGCEFSNFSDLSTQDIVTTSPKVLSTSQISIDVFDYYKEVMNDISSENETLLYTMKDIDGNGIKELIIKFETAIAVYTYNDEILKIGEYDFNTGTLRMFGSENDSYPGIICVTTGGGKDHYAYLTIRDNQLSLKRIWAEDYGMVSGKKEDEYFTEDILLIDISGLVYKAGNDILFEQN